jgi:4-alpha-glucanotransferase
MAGNPLLISPDQLYENGWITKKDLRESIITPEARVDFKSVESNKNKLLDRAFDTFKGKKTRKEIRDFESFREIEKYWLVDYALFIALRMAHGNIPWSQWEPRFKLRDKTALRKFRKENAVVIEKILWTQYVFHQQWRSLKMYCNEKGISLLGDLPFYVSYDSADVWSNKEIFSLNRNGEAQLVAGVPPDYFNSNGQLWGMPVFRWDILKRQRYNWWLKRIKKNCELVDLLRLDHFRAFAAHWGVPATEKTARHGKWIATPGTGLFRELKKQMGRMPFLAEDLGDIDDAVHALREEFSLPGMKVLQFAFGNEMSKSPYIPHNFDRNFAVYTGTHDNNTIRGWYRKDASDIEKQNLYHYVNQAVTEKNVHHHAIRMAYASVAGIAIIPLQDVLGLDERSRMNVPASVQNNWQWRVTEEQLKSLDEAWLLELTEKYNRERE